MPLALPFAKNTVAARNKLASHIHDRQFRYSDAGIPRETAKRYRRGRGTDLRDPDPSALPEPRDAAASSAMPRPLAGRNRYTRRCNPSPPCGWRDPGPDSGGLHPMAPGCTYKRTILPDADADGVQTTTRRSLRIAYGCQFHRQDSAEGHRDLSRAWTDAISKHSRPTVVSAGIGRRFMDLPQHPHAGRVYPPPTNQHVARGRPQARLVGLVGLWGGICCAFRAL